MYYMQVPDTHFFFIYIRMILTSHNIGFLLLIDFRNYPMLVHASLHSDTLH